MLLEFFYLGDSMQQILLELYLLALICGFTLFLLT